MATIRKNEGKKRTTYTVTIRKTGYATESQSFPTLTRAKAWATGVEAKMDDGKWNTGISNDQPDSLSVGSS